MTSLVVERAGVRTLVQDEGRMGLAHLGISAGGAWDRAAFLLANRLVGNEPGAACLEVVLGNVALRARGDCLVALTGAPCPATLDDRPVDHGTVLVVRDGQLLSLGAPVRGLRTMVAVRGGIDAEPVFGSRSSDPTTGLGPAVVRTGSELPVGTLGTRALSGSDLTLSLAAEPEALVLGATWGPRDDWFTPGGRAAFVTTTWQVSDQSDRVGTRLSGPALERAVQGELASEAVVRGAVQVPSSGIPLVFGPDHPTTGGYPVIVVVDGPDADLLAQAAPGRRLRFNVRRNRIDL